ncbi:hypothetical protein EYZ11_012003 [Aspergillus tanneri]|uniref:Uncharacterized protein n=1 Tax=Aspergillus tanneri TaxID=1220188 RepID=A0A4S3J1C3_9EURO|nr:uncharacterized protein ATNIH1004_011756 [Aspergillus tanneri]KAA8641620.1 hypothetical protein ATNIH1004_011756 [Aspergillus tanneri]THC88553.1 hypothetical protein EYZ11_012003 [Aspergillus tanneri]
MHGERIRINVLVVLGDDIVDSYFNTWPDNKGDEDMLVMELPKRFGRPVLVEGTALAAHFNFMY